MSLFLPHRGLLLKAPGGGAASYPVVLNGGLPYKQAFAAATSRAVNWPPVSAGDLLQAFFVVPAAAGINVSNGGFTTSQQIINGTNVTLQSSSKVCTGSETGTFNATTGASLAMAVIMYKIQAGTYGTVDANNPQASGTGATGSSNAPNPPSWSPFLGSHNWLWFAAYGMKSSHNTTAYPYPDGNDGIGQASLCCVAGCWKQSTGATEDPGAFTSGNSTFWAANTAGVMGLT